MIKHLWRRRAPQGAARRRKAPQGAAGFVRVISGVPPQGAAGRRRVFLEMGFSYMRLLTFPPSTAMACRYMEDWVL